LALLKVAVIVSTYNAIEALHKTLLCLCQQTYPAFEVWLADDGSTDETRAFVEQFKANHPQLALHHVWHPDEGFRKAAITNQAVAASTGDYLIFLDGDCLVPPEFVATHVRLAKAGCYISGGSQINLPPHVHNIITPAHLQNAEVFTWAWLQHHTPGLHGLWRFHPWVVACAGVIDAVIMGPNQFKGCNTSCWRSDFKAVGGFNTTLEGYGYEDRDIGLRLLASGVWGQRHQVALRYLHCNHHRPYADLSTIKANKAKIMQRPWWQVYSAFIASRLKSV
jgi:glycosyltransferase involved in cell wall biosynthesis